MADIEARQEVPLLTGAAYAKIGPTGDRVEGILTGTITYRSGRRCGYITFPGYKPELYEEGDESTNALELIGRLASPKVGRPRKDS